MENKINKKGLVGVYIYVLTLQANNITSGILAYIMMTYSEVPQTKISMLLTIPAIVGTIFAFISGTVLNKIGAKKMLLFIHTMMFLSGMIYLFFGVKTNIYILWIACSLIGFMMGGNTVVLGQIFSELVPELTQRGKLYGYAMSLMSLGGVFYSSVSGVIAARNGGTEWNKAYILHFIMIIGIILEYILIPDNKPEKSLVKASKEKVNEKLPIRVYLLSLNYAFFYLALYTFSLNLSEYVISVHKLGTSVESGLSLSFLTGGGIISGLLFGFYSKLLKEFTIPCLMSLSVIGLGLCCFVPNIYVLYASSIMFGFSMMGCGPYVVTKLQSFAPGKLYPKAMSIYSGFMNVGMMVAVYVLALLAKTFTGDANNVDAKFMIALVMAVVVLVTAIPIYKTKTK